MKTIVAGVLALGISADAFALRCGNELILEGDLENKVVAACGLPSQANAQVLGTDPLRLVYKEGNLNTTVKIVNGRVNEITTD